MQKVTVHQYVYVAQDKTRAFVVLFDTEGNEIDSRHFVQDAFPLIDIAANLCQYVTKTLRASLNPDIIRYNCNILGVTDITRTGRDVIHSRLIHDNRRKILTPPIKENTEEVEHEQIYGE